MKKILYQIVEAKKNGCVKALKEAICLCKAFSFAAEILKGSFVKRSN